jgi:DNA-binding PadR family transcriptional regulator
MMTNAELAILSLIAENPRHGYQIEGIIEERGMRDWTEIGFSSIYYLLNKLEKAGLIQSQLQQPQGKGPSRKVYTITQEGKQVLIDGAINALITRQGSSVPFLLGLSNYPIIPRERLVEALNTHVNQIEDQLVYLSTRVEEQSPLPAFVEAMFDYSRSMAKAELNWIRNFIKQVEHGDV